MGRSKNKTIVFRLPYSHEIIGAVAKSLDLEHGVLKERTARRFFKGNPVSDTKRTKILEAVGEAVVKLGLIPEPAVLKQYKTPMTSVVAQTLDSTSERWDALLATLQSRSARIEDYTTAVVGFMRLVVVDLSLRTFALARLADLDLPESSTPSWAEEDSQRNLLRQLVKDAGLTREQLADLLKISDTSVDNWLDGKIRPTRKNVAALAEELAIGRPKCNALRIERDIQRQFTLAHLVDLLVPVIGRRQIVELGTALYRFTRIITDDVSRMKRPPLEQNPTAELVALIFATDHWSTQPLIENLAAVEKDPKWRSYILAAAGEWEVAFQRIAIEASTSRAAAGLAQDITDIVPSCVDQCTYSVDVQTPNTLNRLRTKLLEESSIDYDYRVTQGGMSEISRLFRNGIALRRELTKDFPNEAEAHFELGSFLGMVGKRTGRRDLIEEGIHECKIASLLSPQWDAPAVEPGIILANIGSYEDALEELKWANSVLPDQTPHLHYAFGYTLMMLKRYDEALSHLKEVLKSKPNYALALRDAAHCSFKKGDHKNGLSYAKKARQFGDPVEHKLWSKRAYRNRRTQGRVY